MDDLGLNVPYKLALLPRNFQEVANKDELLYAASAATVKKLWKSSELPYTLIEKDGERI